MDLSLYMYFLYMYVYNGVCMYIMQDVTLWVSGRHICIAKMYICFICMLHVLHTYDMCVYVTYVYTYVCINVVHMNLCINVLFHSPDPKPSTAPHFFPSKIQAFPGLPI